MADKERTLTFQFKLKTFGNADKAKATGLWLQRMLRMVTHKDDLTLELVEDVVKDETAPIPGLEGF